MNWRALDLNLLIVFDAVAQTGSVTLAADRLNMTQPAVSHALIRLRRALGDELFVRTPDGMEPTAYAERLRDPVRAALGALGAALDGAADFEPASCAQRFTVAMNNRAALVLAAPFASLIAAEAPDAVVQIRPSGTLDLAERLDCGELDLVVGGVAATSERFRAEPLFECGFVALVRRGHPAGRDGRLGIKDLGAYPHLRLSSTGEETDFLDEVLAGTGLRRRVAFSGPLLAAPSLLAGSDMIAIIGETGARAFARNAPLDVLALPFETPRLITSMLWHRRQTGLPAHRWLRSILLKIAGGCGHVTSPDAPTR